MGENASQGAPNDLQQLKTTPDQNPSVTTAVAYLVVTWSKKPLDRVRNHVDENVYAFSNDSTIVQAHPS